MEDIGIVGLLLILTNGLISYKGLKDDSYLDRYSFRVGEVLSGRDYKRLVTSGFLHVSWTHLIFNMLTLYCFSNGIESILGATKFLLIYFCSLLGGNLFALFVHRSHSDYSAVGASGAISGIVFASLALFPGIEIGFVGLPLHIPGWAYALLYVLFSIYGIRSQRDNIGHEAHLGGGLIGLLVAIIMVPSVLMTNYVIILLILLPSSVFIYLLIRKPGLMLTGRLVKKKEQFFDIDEKYNSEKRDREKELDRILDKISKKGIHSLTKSEKEKLKQLSAGR